MGTRCEGFQVMKTIATINFKGGVGKTTATWALGKVAPNVKTIFCPQ